MADNENKVDLRNVEPLRPAPDTDPEPRPNRDAGDDVELSSQTREPTTTEDEELARLRRD